MKDWKEIKALPNHLQPKILSAVAYINSAAPNMSKSVERINTLMLMQMELDVHLNHGK